MIIKQNLKVLFFLSRKRADKNGACPIYVRITVNGLRDEASTGCKVTPRNWDNENKKCTTNTSEAVLNNNKLSRITTEAEKAYFSLEMQQEKILPQDIFKQIFPEKYQTVPKAPPITVDQRFSMKVENLFSNMCQYFIEDKKIEKCRDERLKQSKAKLHQKTNKEIKEIIEKLVKETNKGYANGEIAPTLMNAVYEFIIQFARKVMGNQRRFSTLKKFHYTKEKIKDFIWYHYNRTEIKLDEIQFSFAQNFYDYLTLVNNCANNLAMKYIKNTKQILDRAINNDWIIKNPIHGYHCQYIEPHIDPVVMEDIRKMINLELNGTLEMVRDAFLFSIFTGFAYQDTRRLQECDITTGIDGKKWISTNRIKTDVDERVPLLPLPVTLIEKYQNHPCRKFDGKLLPIFSNKTYNEKLKVIAKECDIKINLTTHIARHTFATVITLENDVPLATVGKMMGAKDIRTVQRYAKATQKKVSRNMEVIKSKLFTKDGHIRDLKEII